MNTFEENSRTATQKRLVIFLHTGFFVIGIVTVLLGQILPYLSRNLTVTDEQAGYFFIAQFGGSLTGTFFFSRTIKRFGYLKMLGGGFTLMALGCFGLDLGSWLACLASIYIYGIGIGATIPVINLLIIQMNREKSAAASNIINFFWGIGAIVCKPFVDLTASSESIFLPTALLGGLLLLNGAAILFSGFQPNFADQAEVSGSDVTPVWKTSTAWLIAFFAFLQVGIEGSVGGWITTYETRLTETAADRVISAAPVFFLFLVVGRGIAPLLLRYFRENALMFGNLFWMSGGIILILLTQDFVSLLVGAALLGFGTSSIYPMNIARFMKIFGSRAVQNSTPLFVLGSFGAAFTTWLVGFVSTNFNSLRTGFAVILISCFWLFILQIALSKNIPKQTADF